MTLVVRRLALTLAVALTACGQVSLQPVGEVGPISTDIGGTSTGEVVAIAELRFRPGELFVPRGTAVRWTNQDEVPHTVMGIGEDRFNSGQIQWGGSYSHNFRKAGRFEYICNLHPGMQGVIVVE